MSGISYQSGHTRYSSKKFGFQSNLYVDSDYAGQVGLSGTVSTCDLSPDNIVQFEYENELNKLFLTGRIEYNDTVGNVANFIGRQHVFCHIQFFEYEQSQDVQPGVEHPSETAKFIHEFMVSNIEILERTNDSVVYALHLVGAEWLKCSQTVNYSNYDTDESAIFDILQECFINNGLDSDLSGGPDVRIHYATNGSDTCFSVMQYLLHKSYYMAKRATSPKFIRFDELSSKYVVFDTQRPVSNDFSVKPIVVSVSKDSFEQSMHEERNELAAVSKRSGMAALEDQFEHKIYNYSITTNALTYELITSENIAEYYNTGFSGMKPRYVPQKPTADGSYERCDSYWNNVWKPYNDLIADMFESDSVVVNTVGYIRRAVGSTAVIVFPKDGSDCDTDNYKLKEDYERRYQGLEGEWIIGRVHNIIYPAEGRYRQNLVLIRNFCNHIEI